MSEEINEVTAEPEKPRIGRPPGVKNGEGKKKKKKKRKKKRKVAKKTGPKTPVLSRKPMIQLPDEGMVQEAIEESRKAIGPQPLPKNLKRLRYEAGLRYTTDPNGMTIVDLHNEAKFSVVSYDTLRNWAFQDKWTQRRKEIWLRWRELAEQQIGTELARLRLEWVRDLSEVKDQMLRKLKSEDAPPFKSFESTVNAMTNLMKLLDEKTETLGHIMADNVSSAKKVGAGKVPFAQDEMDLLKQKLFEQRRQRLAAGEPTEPQGGDPNDGEALDEDA